MKFKFDIIMINIVGIVSIIFLFLSVFLYFGIIFSEAFDSPNGIINSSNGVNFSSIFQGVVGTTSSVAGAMLIILVFLLQNRNRKISQLESNFFKMIEFHRDNVKSITIVDYRDPKRLLSGTAAFVNYKLQLFECLELVKTIVNENDINISSDMIIDISYMIFYYGISLEWEDFSHELLKEYPKELLESILRKVLKIEYEEKKRIGRTNQTYLSSYFRNLFNAITLIHSSPLLTKDMKRSYIKVIRSQLSNHEQALLYFNVKSRFGTKWKKLNLVSEYSLIKNLPTGYCQDFDFKRDFPMKYEDDELILIKKA